MALDVGNTGITSADTLTVNGAGGLSNGRTSEINIEGSASVQATLNVANAAAGFGSGKGVETGTVVLENDALLEFKTGSITTVDGELTAQRRERPRRRRRRDHQQQRADRPDQRYRQFLSGERRKGRADRQFEHHRQRHREPRRAQFVFGGGGTSLTIGGTLTNSSSNSNGVSTSATPASRSADTLTVKGTGGLSNTGDINIEGGRFPPRESSS